jgi:zinc protease
MLFVFVVLLFGSLLCAVGAPNICFDSSDETEIPLNPDIVHGKLENGLTYYILKNAKPEDKVELRLALNAGSLQEEEAQLGLAHFMEHMNFNGTKHFEKNELVDYLQSVGVKFGAHLNAYTSFDETVYMLSLPTDDEEVLEKGFLVLEDWAHNANLTEEEIDKERGVVLEEYRIGLGAGKRMLNRYLPKVMYGSKYAERLPIGTKEVLENFDYDVLRSYYNDWYRPDLMAVIVVGDIDPAEIEQKIVAHFSTIENPPDPRTREEYDVPNHEETFVAIESDEEYPYSQVQLMYKDIKPRKDVKTMEDYQKLLATNLFTRMLNSRLDELRNSANPPFSYSGAYYGSSWARTKNAFQMYAMVGEAGQLDGLRAMLTETQRIKIHGFNESELERAKSTILARMEKMYNERDKSESRAFAGELVSNFLENEPAPGIVWEYEMHQKLMPGITLPEVNELINSFIKEENRVIILLGPEKEGLEQVSEEEVLALLDETDAMKPDPYEDKLVAKTLIEQPPRAGEVMASEYNEVGDYKIITLSNGMQVTYKITDYKNDEIVMRGYSYGGTSNFTDDEYLKTHLANRVMSSSGVGEFSQVDLNKMLSGKVVRINSYLDGTSESFSGSARPKDLETMFQLIHLYFTAPRKDQQAFDSYVIRMKNQYTNLESNPQTYFSIQHQKFLSQNDVRSFSIPTDEDWARIDYDLIYEKYKEAFANPGDFKLFFSGNIDEDQFVDYAKTYLASIPGIDREDQIIDRGVRPPEGTHEKVYYKGIDPKSYVVINFEGEADFNRTDQFHLKCFSDILTIKLIEIMREEKGGVYGVGARGSLYRSPYPRYSLSINFPCGPENAQELKEAALGELRKIIEEGPTEKDLNKVKEEKRKTLKENLRTNSYRVNKFYGDSFTQGENLTDEQLAARIEDLTAEDIQNVGKKYLTGDYIVGILMPEESNTQ